ncbi:glycerophosphodiester phosphodiesterase [Vibrio sp. TBV020]|uniref:glycerophosphodiester phosphodiesterase n=1 Tax=Vibrio sp. TBV020 TaxID=3137398 RepID=UPI0038CDB296
MIIVGHRGVAGRFPENTKASFTEAIELGLKWIEVDIQPSLDGHLVVCHDHTVDRCSNGTGRVDSLTLSQLRQLDFGARFHSSHTTQTIMTLSELLEFAHDNQIELNLEIKVDRHDKNAVCEQLVEALEQGKLNQSRILISSFDHDVLKQVRQTLPDIRIGVLAERFKQQHIRLLHEINAFSYNLNYRWVNRQQIETLHKQGFQVWCYTVNNPNLLKHRMDLDAIFSDFPERFL